MAVLVTYTEMLSLQKKRLEWMEKDYPTNSKIPHKTKEHNLECQRMLVKLLEKHKKDPQLNMNELFDKL